MKDVICEDTVRRVRQRYRDRVRAVVLTGSLARNEGTFVEDDQGCRLLGDAEFLLVFDEGAARLSGDDVTVLQERIVDGVRRRGLRAKVTLSVATPAYLRQLPPSIFAYELKACGETVAGDAGVLGLIREFPRAAIPLEDAWRLLANRLVEQLESVDELLEGRPALSPDAHYRTVKLYLDMATSLLVFLGGYAPTYAERAESLARIAGAAGTIPQPFPLGRFADDVAAWTEWKLAATKLVDVDRTFWERAMGYAKSLWAWELARLQDRDRDGAPRALGSRWIRQALRARVRGWAHVVRKRGWQRSWRLWPRWLRQAVQGSPRDLVYRAASTFMFELNGTAANPALMSHLRLHLPVARWPGQRENESPRALAEAILANYRSFLIETRA